MAGAGFQTSLFTSEWISASRSVPRSEQRVMIVLHGRGDSLESFRSIKQELRLKHMNYLLLNAPRRYERGYSWCALEPRHQKQISPLRQRLFTLVDELKLSGWRSEDLFWLGHSQGCLVACDLVLNHPDAFGGLIGVSGYLWFFRGWRERVRFSGAKRTPWLMTHGTRDQVISPREIREDVSYLTDEVPVLYREFSKGHDFDYREEVPFIRSWIGRPRDERRALGRLSYQFELR
jgi:phospholipase/carboxylesterase